MRNSFPPLGNENHAIYNLDELIDLFLKCTADGFAIVDMEDRFLRINHIYTEIFGYTEEDLLGKKFSDFTKCKGVVDIVRQVKEGKSFANMITKRYHKDGSVLDIAVSYSPFRNISGEIIAVIAIYRDITKIVGMEKELHRTRELYELITENTSDMIIVFTKDKKIVYASPSHEKVVGRKPEEIIGKRISEFLTPMEDKVLDQKLEEILQKEEPVLLKKTFLLLNGQTVHTEYNFSPIHNGDKMNEAFVGVGRNITDRMKNEEALRNLDRLSITGQLAAGVAHEIRNPLTSLKGFSKLLTGCTNPQKQTDYLNIILNELDRIDMIVNEFMSLAKPQAIQFEAEDLRVILESTINIIQPQALMNSVQIVVSYPQDEIKLLCVPHQLKQVFLNFLKNAIEAMPNGGEVCIDIQKDGLGKVMVSICDKGSGIDQSLLKHLGTPFYTTKDKGIGLGLTVSNKIIQEHNGSMDIESIKGKGTTVNVSLKYIK